MHHLFDQASTQHLHLALACLHDRQLFKDNVLIPVVVQIFLDNDLQHQLHWLAHCDWDMTMARLTYDPQSLLPG